MPTRKELLGGAAFFALAAVAIIAFRRPFDLTGWAVVVTCICFVAFAFVGLIKPNFHAGFKSLERSRAPSFKLDNNEQVDEPLAKPTTEEMHVLNTSIAALEAVGGLNAGEVDAMSLWKAAMRSDPGQPVGIYEALGSFAALHEFDRTRVGRLTFVPSHTEYDAPLLAEITASILVSLGRPVQAEDIGVTLPPDNGHGTAQISFPVGGRTETIDCSYLWKYPPPDLPSKLAYFGAEEDPRQLVGADPGDQTLLFVAIRKGSLGELNRLLPAEQDLFYEA